MIIGRRAVISIAAAGSSAEVLGYYRRYYSGDHHSSQWRKCKCVCVRVIDLLPDIPTRQRMLYIKCVFQENISLKSCLVFLDSNFDDNSLDLRNTRERIDYLYPLPGVSLDFKTKITCLPAM